MGMEFCPSWWDNQRVEILRIKFILPEGCDISEVGHYPLTAENRGMEGGKAFVYFERANISLGYKFICGVSFPEEYVTGSIEVGDIYPTEKPETPATTNSQGEYGLGSVFEELISWLENLSLTRLIIILAAIITVGGYFWNLFHSR
ncbi:MAG: hypothetical protein HXS46_02500 [Theionarchaea archaeon]|nr:hypothetical protein [Theionarchaea archaeon]